MSGGNVDELMNILAGYYEGDSPFADHEDLYSVIDSIEKGTASWESFSISYTGPDPEGVEERPDWMNEKYEVWFRNPDKILTEQLANPEFKGQVDYAPLRAHDAATGERLYDDMMTGNWCWREAVCYNSNYVACNCAHITVYRIKFIRLMLLHSVHHLSRSSSEAIRLQLLLPRAIINIILSISQLATYITMSGVRTVVLFLCLVFLPYQRVSQLIIRKLLI
jgi:hypothetical protein